MSSHSSSGVITSGYNEGDYVVFACDDENDEEEDRNQDSGVMTKPVLRRRTCLSNGTWDDGLPVCGMSFSFF